MLNLSLPPTIPTGPLVFYFAVFAIKHVLCDFPLQSPWMAIGKDKATGWARPLLAHCLVHGVASGLLLIAFVPHLWFLGIVDFLIHLAIDRGKGILAARYDLTPDDRPFWSVLGVDQALHHATGFGLALVIACHA